MNQEVSVQKQTYFKWTFLFLANVYYAVQDSKSYWAVLSCDTVNAVQGGSKGCNQLNESYWGVLTCGTVYLYMVVLTFESVDKILKCDHSNKSYWAVLFCTTVYFAVQGGPNVRVCGWNPRVISQIKATEQYSPEVMFILLYRVAESKDIVYLPGKIRVHGG